MAKHDTLYGNGNPCPEKAEAITPASLYSSPANTYPNFEPLLEKPRNFLESEDFNSNDFYVHQTSTAQPPLASQPSVHSCRTLSKV
jgi:hypothetical protein